VLELGGLDGLGQVQVEAGVERLLPVLGLPVSGERDQPKIPRVGVCTEQAREPIAVDPGQPDVDEGHVGPERRDLLEATRRILRRLDLVPAQLEDEPQAVARVGAVLWMVMV
jgi:hypothetical protein